MRGTGARGVCGRAGFTLVELLVTVAIIAILAGVGLSTLFLAQEAAREDRTRMLISKLHNQLMIRWESYQTRRLPLQIMPGESPKDFAKRLLWGRRELMRMELPERYVDIGLPMPNETPFVPSIVPPSTSPVVSAMIRRINIAAQQKGLTLLQMLQEIGKDNERAECLYLIVTTGMQVDASGKKIFDERHVGDTDDDGMLEFVDGWGQAIQWIRWPAGFVSDLQPVHTALPNETFPNGVFSSSDAPLTPRTDSSGATITRRPSGNADSLDVRLIDLEWDANNWTNGPPIPERDYRIYPLIVSPGPDGRIGLFLKPDGSRPFDTISNAQGITELETDPYVIFHYTDGDPSKMKYGQFGKPLSLSTGQGHLDNIHNHDLMGR